MLQASVPDIKGILSIICKTGIQVSGPQMGKGHKAWKTRRKVYLLVEPGHPSPLHHFHPGMGLPVSPDPSWWLG